MLYAKSEFNLRHNVSKGNDFFVAVAQYSYINQESWCQIR